MTGLDSCILSCTELVRWSLTLEYTLTGQSLSLSLCFVINYRYDKIKYLDCVLSLTMFKAGFFLNSSYSAVKVINSHA